MDRSSVRKIVEVIVPRSADRFKDEIAILTIYGDAGYIADAIARFFVHYQDFFRVWVLVSAAPLQMGPGRLARIVYSHHRAMVAIGVRVPCAHPVRHLLGAARNRQRQNEDDPCMHSK